MDIVNYLRTMPFAEECFPFGPDTAVFKVSGKMFALHSIHQGRPIINVKGIPEENQSLCDVFADVIPGYHMNKKHWVTVFLDGDVPKGEIERLIDQSHKLVYKPAKRKKPNS
ncbi:MmcQ/YjbR family DNA-binding protein [Alteromonas sediminis]|uniref:MmcQ/YjbR family DNA-binding protein n=1 Tax=Alteromonas sediminis TaxID=2259342 RepID=A0A3N5Y8J0_9ALTE|nr:MmcQ/YjbR family DNA-binding protein [Alteromonas sediminis]RPJ67389.1 MmcQ/YjbR family DNA-binding protein [Alteromonas sediminis]